MKTLKIKKPFITETGEIIPELEIAYNTYGNLDGDSDNVIWICHALTANSDAETWWPGMVGEGLLTTITKSNAPHFQKIRSAWIDCLGYCRRIDL